MQNFFRSLGLSLVMVMSAGAQATPELTVTVAGETVSFRLHPADEKAPWVLQNWAQEEGWKDLIFLEAEDGQEGLASQFSRQGLPSGASNRGLFRALKRDEDDAAYRDYLAARMRWRLADIPLYSYTYEVYSQLGVTERQRTVKNGEVVFDGPISDFGPYAEMTIDDWFDEVGEAFADGAALVDVDWHEDTGYPERGYLDLDERIADEEKSWAITGFAPLGKDGPEYQEFLTASEAWKLAGISDYQYIVRYWVSLSYEEIRFTVRNGVVVEAEKLDGSSGSPDLVEVPADATIDYWIAEIAEAFDNQIVSVEVDWDDEAHFPERVSLDDHPDLFDSGRGWTIRDLELLEIAP